jgi:hypothetical protein
MTRKIHLITLVFANMDVLDHGFAALHRTTDGCREKFIHWFVDRRYPIGYDRLSFFLATQCNVIRTVDENVNLAEAFNRAMEIIDPDPEDYIVIYDSNSEPLTVGWLDALADVLDSDPSFATIGVLVSELENRTLLGEFEEVAGHSVFLPSYVPRLKMTMSRASFLREVGVEMDHPFYGNIETRWINKVHELGFRWGFLQDFHEGQGAFAKADDIYLEWKQKHLEGFNGDFRSYLMQLKSPDMGS